MINIIIMRLLELFDYKAKWVKVGPETWKTSIDNIDIKLEIFDEGQIDENYYEDEDWKNEVAPAIHAAIQNNLKFPLSASSIGFTTKYKTSDDIEYTYLIQKLDKFIATKIFSAVGHMLTELIQQQGSDIYMANSDSDEPSRAKLYNKLFPLLGSKLNNYEYVGPIKTDDGSYEYCLVKKHQ